MLGLNMTAPEGITLATAGKYCPENVKVTPVLQEKTVTPGEEQQVITADSGMVGLSRVTVEAAAAAGASNVRQWEVELAQDYAKYCALLTDEWLKEHRSDDGLKLLIYPRDGVSGAYSVALSFARNTPWRNDTETESNMHRQTTTMVGTSEGEVRMAGFTANRLDGTDTTSPGTIWITNTGKLAYRGGSFCILRAGVIKVIAWIDE